MNQTSMFLLEAFVIVALPVVLLRISGLKGLMPLVVVQIAVGIAMGPSIFGRLAPDYFHMFAGPESLSSFSGVAFVAVLIFGMVSGLHVEPPFSKASNEHSGRGGRECRRADDAWQSGGMVDLWCAIPRTPPWRDRR